ncbi:MAG: DNA primase [Nanoarchaeota archaeon]|nr:DNA primase [Nanoarchaeota archaeon]
MAKISPVSIKYTVHAKFNAEGPVEKPDVIGALFGQTEGLLGNELEMRELQKEGKIGRIEVELRSEGGKTAGEIHIPSALDKAETALIGAAIETIDKIGPTEATIEVERIEDVRGEKRSFIVDRAKKLLESIEGTSESREITDDLKTQSRLAKLQDYGKEKLPAGDISEHEVIVVEGRADVVNLLKNNVNNVIGMDGTKLPETIKELSYDKEITLFVDGDRGGQLIARNVYDNARIDFIAVAPDGKEVEELQGKEILTALRRKIPSKDFFRSRDERQEFRRNSYEYDDRRSYPERREWKREPFIPKQESVPKEEPKSVEFGENEKEKLKKFMEEIEGTKSAYLLDDKLDVVKKVSSRGIGASLMRNKASVIVIDGMVTGSVIQAAEGAGVNAIAAKNFASTDTKIKLISL